ncbi:Mlp1p [Sporobolomyces koalae]|uniref:Mlp1p n=1 Tax=Sporobolomyces koalae TaxID=500713 RepID=UPI00317222AF
MSDPPATLEQQYEALQAESTRQQIEAEQTLHDLSSKLADAVAQHEQAQASAQDAQSKLAEESRKRQDAEERLKQFEQSRQHDQQGDAELKQQLEAVDKDKRQLMIVIEKEQRDRADVEESLASLRTVYSRLQTSHSELEADLASTKSASRTSLLRVQTLQSTVSSLEADNAFLKAELERGRSEWSAYRREKHAEITKLQADLEDKTVAEHNAKTGLDSLKKVHEQLKEKHTSTLSDLAKVREELGANEGNFATEMASMRRLVELMEKREEERKKRVEEVERALDDERNALAEKEDELRDQLLQERERGDSLETRYHEVRDALERGHGYPRDGGDFVPGTPGSVASDSFALSPSAQLAVRGQKSGRSYAEIYGEYIKMEEELAKERAETRRLGEILAQILGDIEERAPLLQEQRVEYERLSLEATQLASQLAQALTDRDASERRTESFRLDVDRLSTDNVILNQQLSDLGRQIRTLTRILAASENTSIEGDANDAAFDEEEKAILRRAEESGDTDSVVSAHLVTFRTVNELQVQNQKLLKITRQMGQQLEKGEEEAAARRRGEENKAVEEAHELILRLKEEVESQRARTEAYEKERDMFRRMLAQRGVASSDSSGPVEGASNLVASDLEATRLLSDVQANFDAYKDEIAIDTQRLREDLAQAQKDASAARTELAKSKAQYEFMSERFRLLTETYELREGEIKESQKRAFELQQTLVKQDSSIHRMSEELLELRSSAEQLRHENTNFKSEREVAKNVENRLVEENASLSRERAQLSDLMRNLQTMQNELERTGNDARRRLEENVIKLETQTSELREKLNQAEESNRQLALRKEIEGKTLQDRIDKLTTEYSSTRETLAAASASKEHLEQRVRDLAVQIEAKEEKLAIFEGRTSVGEGDSGRTVEEQLQVTLAELRGELRTAQDELERAQKHVKQYQAIAETEGERLREVSATYDEFKASTESSLVEKDSEITSLRERLHSLTTDLTASSTQNSELHRQIEDARVNFEKERKLLEDEMVSLRAADQSARDAQLAAQDDMRRQAQLAKDAHDKYERELVAHAEDVKRLSEVKEQLESVRATIREHQTAAEVAKANLVSSEQSWTRQKEALTQELADVRKRAEELKEQNSTLAQHLETATAQASQLQSRHAAIAAGTSADGAVADADAVDSISASHAASVEQLREVIRYLRREKEIIDLQFDYSKQEAARLRQQLEYTERGLTETRQALTEERQKAGESLASSAQHTELLESIHTAKLLRESNQTLRDENEANIRKVTSLDSQLRQAQAEIEPLREQVRVLQAEVEAKQNNMRLLEEDNERWKTRNQTILAKYERIDPEELQVLKNEVERVQAILTSVEVEKADLAKQIEEKTAFGESMRQNWQNGLDRFKALQTQARSTRDERNVLTKEVEELKAKLEAGNGAEAAAAASAAAAQAQSDSQAALAELQTRLTALEAERDALNAKLAEQQTEQSTNDDSLKSLQNRFAVLEQEKATVTAEKDRLAAREGPLFRDNKRMTAQTKTLQADLEKLSKEHETLKASVATDNTAAIETLVQTRLAELAPASTPAPTQPTEEQIAALAQERIAAKEVEFVAQRDEAVRVAVKQVTDEFEAQLQAAKDEISKLQAAGGTIEAGTDTSAEAINTALEKAKKDMEAEFEKVKATMQEESAKREKEIKEQLSAEIKKLQAAAADRGPAPNVDALVQEKLAAIEKQRNAAHQEAISKAVAEALEKQKANNEQALTVAKAQIEKQAHMKNNLLNKSVAGMREKLALYQEQLKEAGITPGVPKKPAPAAAAGAATTASVVPGSTATTSPAAAPVATPAPAPVTATPAPPTAANGVAPPATTPASTATAGAGRGGLAAVRGRGAARGARGAGQANRGGRGGAANAGAPSPPPPAQPASPVGMTLRGAARGGVLGQLLGQGGLGVQGAAAGAQAAAAAAANAAKRQREGQQGDAEGDAKRPKGGA